MGWGYSKMPERNDSDQDVERDEFSLRGDFGPAGSWGTFGDRPDFTRDYEWRYCGEQGQSEDWGEHLDWGNDEVVDNYSGGNQTYSGKRAAR